MRLALVLGVGTALAGCQDAVAPITDSGLDGGAPSVAMSREFGQGRQLIKDQYIVVYRDGHNDVDARSARLMAGKSGKVKHAFKSGIKGFVGGMTAAEAAAIAADPSVAYVEQDQTVALGVAKPIKDTSGNNGNSGNSGNGGGNSGNSGKGGNNGKGGGNVSPTEPSVGTQTPVPSWGLDRIDEGVKLLNNTYTYASTGEGVHVYIIDSGIRTSHVDFEGRATADFSLINDGYGATGCNFHGTHVAGTVGGASAGVAKKVRLHSVRVLDCNAMGTVGGVVAGIDWVIANRVMPAVINLSITAGASQFFVDAVDRAVAAGITVVAAAGNNGADACDYSPANAPNALSVGSTTMADIASAYSNQGPCVDIMAPGQFIGSASNADDVSFLYSNGTSMAAPHVTGVAALYLGKNPLAEPTVVRRQILESATPGALSGLEMGTPNLILRTP